jgi:hypothetical protein
MATVPLYDATIGVANHSLLTLLDLLQLAQAHPDAATLPKARLAEDMLPFSTQIQIVSDFAKKFVERLTGRELEVWENNEETLEQLIARVEKTIALLKTVKREDVDNAPRTQSIKMGPFDPVTATMEQYVFGYAQPNLLFHLSTAYLILRSKGFELGKAVLLKHFVGDFFTGAKTEK